MVLVLGCWSSSVLMVRFAGIFILHSRNRDLTSLFDVKFFLTSSGSTVLHQEVDFAGVERNYVQISWIFWFAAEFSLSLRPCGASVFNLSIQKSSLCSNRRRFSCCDRFTLSCSISVNLACWLNECPGSKKCLSKAPPVGLLTSCLCVFMRRFAGGSLLPTYCLAGQSSQWPRYRVFLLRQFRSCLMSNSSPVTSLLKVFVDCKWRQHRFFFEDKQAFDPGKRGFRYSLMIFLFLDR